MRNDSKLFLSKSQNYYYIAGYFLRWLSQLQTVAFYNNYIYSYNIFFFKTKLFKLFLLLECQYNYCLVYESAPLRQVNKSYTSLRLSMSTTRLTVKKSIQERLLSQERKDSVISQVSIGVCQPSSAEEHPETTVKA